MLFYYQDLAKKYTHELQALFTSIPKTESSVEIHGIFHAVIDFSQIKNTLFYLPKHVKEVTFSGEYHYSDIGVGYQLQLGNLLHGYILSLPSTVNKLRLNVRRKLGEADLRVTSSTISRQLKKIFENFPKPIFEVAFNLQGYEMDALSHIPETVQRLSTENIPWHDMLVASESIAHHIKCLHLTRCQLFFPELASLIKIAQALPKGLEQLSLANNDLHKKTPEMLRAFFSYLPPIKALLIANNNLGFFQKGLAYTLGGIPNSVEEVDLGGNGLLLLPYETLKQVLLGLSQQVKQLRLTEEKNPLLTSTSLNQQWLAVPSQIEQLSFSDSDFFGLTLEEFGQALTTIPSSVHTLNFNSTNLGQKRPEEIKGFFSALLPSIKKVTLRRNQLINFAPQVLCDILASFTHVETIDLSENGFDSLFYRELEVFLKQFPANIRWFTLERNGFAMSNNGALIPYAARLPKEIGHFKAQKTIGNQQNLAPLLLPLMQLVYQEKFPLDLACMVFSFYTYVSPKEKNKIACKINTLKISSMPPKKVTMTHQQECLFTIEQRLNALSPTQKHLDLSRCGLNRLDSHKEILKYIKKSQVKSVSFRGNGFVLREKGLLTFFSLLKQMPRNIKHLDLSDNGFEDYSAGQLAQLLLHIPRTVEYITLDEGIPLSPAALLARRHWPHSYYTLTQDKAVFEQGCNLLKDYTKDNSLVGRFFTGHWNRHHVPSMAKLLYLIKQGLITTAEDLLQELNQIPLENNTGSLARRISFFANARRLAKKETIDQQEVFTDTLEEELTPALEYGNA